MITLISSGLVFLHHIENEQPGTEAENAGQLTEDSPATSSDETSAQEWLQVQEKLSAKYRLDGAAQEQAMVRLTKTPEALKTASAFRLLLLLFDPTQFKVRLFSGQF